MTGVEKEKWKTFRDSWGSSGDEGGGRIGRNVDYGLGIANDVGGLSCWGFRGELTVVGDHSSY